MTKHYEIFELSKRGRLRMPTECSYGVKGSLFGWNEYETKQAAYDDIEKLGLVGEVYIVLEVVIKENRDG